MGLADAIVRFGWDDADVRRGLSGLDQRIAGVAEAAGVRGAGKLARLGIAFGAVAAGAYLTRRAISAVTEGASEWERRVGTSTEHTARLRDRLNAASEAFQRFSAWAASTAALRGFSWLIERLSQGLEEIAAQADPEGYRKILEAEGDATITKMREDSAAKLQRMEELRAEVALRSAAEQGRITEAQLVNEQERLQVERRIREIRALPGGLNPQVADQAREYVARAAAERLRKEDEAFREAQRAKDEQLIRQRNEAFDRRTSLNADANAFRRAIERDRDVASGKLSASEAAEAARRDEFNRRLEQLLRDGVDYSIFAAIIEAEDQRRAALDLAEPTNAAIVRGIVTAPVTLASGLGGSATLERQVFNVGPGAGRPDPAAAQLREMQKTNSILTRIEDKIAGEAVYQ